MKTIACDASYSTQILEILNEAILTSTALYDYSIRTMDSMAVWFDGKQKGNYPVTGIMDDNQLIGFATYGPFRNFPAYKYTIEHSIYVKNGFRHKGIGRILMNENITRARTQGYHNIIGVIDSYNQASIQLHLKFGFTHCGRIQHAGFKFSKWLDVDFYQLILNTPLDPQDG